jgi:hypothetical protein
MSAATGAAFWSRGALDRALVDAPEVTEVVWDLSRMSAREMRALPGIGGTRAVELVEARWKTPDKNVFDMRSVPGVGEITASRVQDFLKERNRRTVSRGRSRPLMPQVQPDGEGILPAMRGVTRNR